MVNINWVSSQTNQNYEQATRHYEQATRNYEQAKSGVVMCPAKTPIVSHLPLLKSSKVTFRACTAEDDDLLLVNHLYKAEHSPMMDGEKLEIVVKEERRVDKRYSVQKDKVASEKK